MERDVPLLKMGEVERLTGLSSHTIRVWERRYGVPRPSRSPGRQRLYSSRDVELIRRMEQLSRFGVPLAQAARVALREQEDRLSGADPAGSLARLMDALLNFDEARASALWNAAIEGVDVLTVFDRVAAPLLVRIGELWHAGAVSVAQEHFASHFLRGRIELLSRQAAPAPGSPIVLVACLPGEHHDLAPLMLAAALRYQGLRAVFLGADTPVEAIIYATREVRPAVVALHASTPDGAYALDDVAQAMRTLATRPALVYGGRVFDAGERTDQAGLVYGGATFGAAVQLILQLCGRTTGGMK